MFRERLQALRLRLVLTQEQLAERAGFCQATIWHLETGRNGPHWDTLYRLCEALDVEPEALGVTWEPESLEEPHGDMASYLATSAGMSTVIR